MDQHVATEIVAKGLNTNSYKFALWRALAALAPDTKEESARISKQDLAPLFVKYYWPLEIKYHIRQGIDPDKDPIVMKLIRSWRRLEKSAKEKHYEILKRDCPKSIRRWSVR